MSQVADSNSSSNREAPGPLLSAMDSPPEDVRVRAIKVAGDNGLLHVVAPESSIIDPAQLTPIIGDNALVLSTDPRTPIAAVPGYYDAPTLIEEALVRAPVLALATDQPGVFTRTSGADLLKGNFDYEVQPFSLPVPPPSQQRSREEDSQLIHQTVSRFTKLKIQQRLEETLDIPPLPEAARRIIALRSDPNYDLTDLTRIIESDPALAARIVGWANSAYYSANPPARSIDDAVMRILGFDLVFNMALGLALGDSLRLPKHDVQGLPPFWIEALFNAATMEALARQMPAENRPEPGLCYLSGLLSNFGQLVIGHVFPYQYQRIVEIQAANRHLPHAYADLLVLGIGRETIAATLLESWDLDASVCDAVRYQHLSSYTGSNASYVNLLRLSHQALSYEGVTDYPPQLPDGDLLASLSLDTSRIDAVLELIHRSKESIEELASAIG